MKKFKKLIIACDGESASGKSTAAKLISKKYNLLLVNSGLLYRYGSKLIIKHKPKNNQIPTDELRLKEEVEALYLERKLLTQIKR